jgi:hypothetical protein
VEAGTALVATEVEGTAAIAIGVATSGSLAIGVGALPGAEIGQEASLSVVDTNKVGADRLLFVNVPAKDPGLFCWAAPGASASTENTTTATKRPVRG